MDAATAARICDEQIYPKNAGLYGLSDRGTIQVGKRANICMIDHERLNVHLPRMIFDLPSGRDRLLQGANGFIATLMNGVVTRRNHVETGTRPGRLIKIARRIVAHPAKRCPSRGEPASQRGYLHSPETGLAIDGEEF